MKHCILVKFKPEVKKDEMLYQDIENIFSGCLLIDGIKKVELIKNCIDRNNRYDLLIRIDMQQSALEAYDNCDSHKLWKDKYSKLIDLKAIFDYKENV